ncbi:MAG: oligosaccharide flippase family protein [Bacteroidales bacterium]|nr:oligosaccharide flippase family protein [Bacteroidales bacterium]
MPLIYFPLNRKFVVNIILLVALNLLIKPFWFFGIEVTVQNRLGNEIYGLYASLLSFTILFNFLLDFGITNFNNREIARNRILLEKYFSHILGIKFLFGLVYLILCLLVGFGIGFREKAFFLLLILAFNQFLSSMVLYLRSNVNAMLMFVTDSLLSVLDKFIMIVILSIVLWTSLLPVTFSIEVFVYTQTFAYSITAITAGWIVRQNCRYFRPTLSIRHILVIIRKSLPFTLLVLLMGIYNRMEPVLLERLLPNGNEQAGLYAQGFRILEVLSNFALLFSVLLLPLFSKMLKNKENIVSLLQTASVMLIIPALALVINVYAYRNEWVQLLYHNPASGNVFATIILGFPGICLTYLYGTLLTANGSFRQLNSMALTMVIINLTLNLLLIPRYQAMGSSIASFVTQTTAGIIQVILAIRILKIPSLSFSKTIRLFVWFIAAITMVILLKPISLLWIYKFTLSVMLSIVFAALLKILPLNDWIILVKERISREKNEKRDNYNG